jgi:hypothetical protein
MTLVSLISSKDLDKFKIHMHLDEGRAREHKINLTLNNHYSHYIKHDSVWQVLEDFCPEVAATTISTEVWDSSLAHVPLAHCDRFHV